VATLGRAQFLEHEGQYAVNEAGGSEHDPGLKAFGGFR
jgi:hypothetical protein